MTADALSVDSIDVTLLAVAICHRLHLMNEDPLPCRACITKVSKALPVLSGLLTAARHQTAETIALAIEDLDRAAFGYDDFAAGVGAAAATARAFGARS